MCLKDLKDLNGYLTSVCSVFVICIATQENGFTTREIKPRCGIACYWGNSFAFTTKENLEVPCSTTVSMRSVQINDKSMEGRGVLEQDNRELKVALIGWKMRLCPDTTGQCYKTQFCTRNSNVNGTGKVSCSCSSSENLNCFKVYTSVEQRPGCLAQCIALPLVCTTSIRETVGKTTTCPTTDTSSCTNCCPTPKHNTTTTRPTTTSRTTVSDRTTVRERTTRSTPAAGTTTATSIFTATTTTGTQDKVKPEASSPASLPLVGGVVGGCIGGVVITVAVLLLWRACHSRRRHPHKQDGSRQRCSHIYLSNLSSQDTTMTSTVLDVSLASTGQHDPSAQEVVHDVIQDRAVIHRLAIYTSPQERSIYTHLDKPDGEENVDSHTYLGLIHTHGNASSVERPPTVPDIAATGQHANTMAEDREDYELAKQMPLSHESSDQGVYIEIIG